MQGHRKRRMAGAAAVLRPPLGKIVFFVLNCLQATLITGTIMMFPASCLDTQRMGM